MTGGKSGRNVANDFGRVVGNGTTVDGVPNRNDGVANDRDDVLGTEDRKFHNGPSNLVRRNATVNSNLVTFAVSSGENGGSNAVAGSCNSQGARMFAGSNTAVDRGDGQGARMIGKGNG